MSGIPMGARARSRSVADAKRVLRGIGRIGRKLNLQKPIVGIKTFITNFCCGMEAPDIRGMYLLGLFV